jgi:hypothetical protein
MYTTKRSQKDNHQQYLLSLLGKFLGLVLIFNAVACDCKRGSQDDATSLKIAAENKLLIGDQRRIGITFSIGDAGNPVELENFKLKASIVEQNLFEGKTTGTKVNYMSTAEGSQNFPNNNIIEKPLTEFTDLTQLESTHNKYFTAGFDLLPADDAVEVKLKFELLDAKGDVIDHVDVRWIKSEFAINFPYPFEGIGNQTSFNLKPLKDNIKALSEYKIELKSDKPDVIFKFLKHKETTATLEELLSGLTEKLTQGEVTNLIEIVANPSNNELNAKLTVLVYSSTAAPDSKPIGQQEIEWHGYNQDSATEQEKKELDKARAVKEKLKKESERLKEENKYFKIKEKEANEEFTQAKDNYKEEKSDKLIALKLKLASKEILKENGDYSKEKQAIDKNFKEKVKAAKNKRDEKQKEIREEKQKNKGNQKTKNQELKVGSKKENKERKDLQGAAKQLKYDMKEAPKLALIATKGLVTDKPFILTIKNMGRPLSQEEFANIKLSYKIKNDSGNTSKVFLKTKDSKKTIKSTEKVSLAQISKIKLKKNPFKNGERKHIILEIDGIDLEENVQIILNVEIPNSQQQIPPATVTWEKFKTVQEHS